MTATVATMEQGFSHSCYHWHGPNNIVATTGTGSITQLPPLAQGYSHSCHHWHGDTHRVATTGADLLT